MWPCKLGIGSLSKAVSSSEDKFFACLIDGTDLRIALEPAFLIPVLRLSRRSQRKLSSGFVSQKYPSICVDIFVTWFMVTLDSIIGKSDISCSSWNRENRTNLRNRWIHIIQPGSRPSQFLII